MWDPQNIWLDSWLNLGEHAQAHNLLPIYLPNSDLNDQLLLPDVSKINNDKTVIDAIKDYYRADNVIILTATGDYNPSNQRLSELKLRAFFIAGQWQRDPITLSFEGRGNATVFLREARDMIFNQIQNEWKLHTAIDLGKENHLEVGVEIASLKQWQEINKILTAIPDIDRIRLKQMGKNKAVIEVDFFGNIKKLKQSLAREFLGLNNAKKGWVIKPTRAIQ